MVIKCTVRLIVAFLLARGDISFGWLAKEANDNAWIVYALDWRGFAATDLPVAARMLLHDAENTIKDLEASVIQVSYEIDYSFLGVTNAKFVGFCE